ncbi:MAG: DMT family transporter [Candidatus Krumholzibacteriota bacterium]|nr:DMT family transporter [Candidatus Krumholzibacteriota bacterium]
MPDSSRSCPWSPAVTRGMLVLLFVIWSNAFTAIRHLREIFPPMQLVLARFLPVAIFCLGWLLLDGRRRRESVRLLRTAPLRVAMMGIFGVAGYNVFLYIGQGEIKPGAAALLTTLSPLFTVLLAVPLLREKVPFRRIVGVVVAFTGLYVVVRWGRVGRGMIVGIGDAEAIYALITALAPLSWSLYTIAGKDLLRRWSPLTVTYLSTIIGTLPFLVFADRAFFATIAGMGWTHWLALGHLAVLSTIVGFHIWNTALQSLPATSVASFIYLNPPLAALFGWAIFGEEITLVFLLGSAVVLAGLWLTQQRARRVSPTR